MKKYPKCLRVLNALIALCILMYHLQDLVTIASASTVNADSTIIEEESNNEEFNEEKQSVEDSSNQVNENESSVIIVEEESSGEELPSQSEVNLEESTQYIDEPLTEIEAEQEETNSIDVQSLEDKVSDLPASDNQSRTKGSGLVQFRLEGTTSCGYNHNLYPNGGKSEHTTYINSCYVKDALYLGEDNSYYYIYLSGYEGKVLKEERQGNVRIIAEYIPASPVRTASLGLEEAEVLDVPYLNYADQTLNENEKSIS